MQKLKDLQDKRLELATKIKAFADAEDAKTEGAWSAEADANWQTLNADYDACKASLDAENAAVQKAEDRKARMAAIESYKPTNRIGRDGAELGKPPRNGRTFGTDADGNDVMATAIQGWLKHGHSAHSVGEITDEHRTACRSLGFNVSDGEIRIPLNTNFRQIRQMGRQAMNLASHGETQGGYTIGDSFVNNLELAMLYYGGMFEVSDIIRTNTGEPMRWPTANDTTNSGVQLGENASIGSTSVDPTFAQVIWNAYKFSSQPILVPFELLRDNAVNLSEVIPEMLGIRLGRIQNTRYTLGSGAATAKGIVTAAVAGKTTASATAIAFDEIIDLEHSIDPARRRLPGNGYMFNDAILQAIRKLKDGMGRYLWMAGANEGAPDTLNTYPYTINQDMASSIATTQITMVFGQLKAYKIRQVAAIRLYRLQERYRDTDQDGFIAFIEGDGNLLNSGDNPVKKLTQA